MFRKVKKQLILYNSVSIAVFLLIFVGVSFLGVTWGLYQEEQKEVLVYAEEEAEENLAAFKQKHNEEEDLAEVEPQGEDVVFFCVTDPQRRFLYSSRPNSDLCRGLYQTANKRGSPREPFLAVLKNGGRNVIVMMVSYPIQDKGKIYGNIDIGKDVTPYYKILKKLLFVLSGVLIIFLIFVTFVGYALAGRAMKPIQKSYERQREFLADASHELRTPLSVLLTSVDAVQSDDDNTMSSFTGQVLVDMKDEIRKMSKIVRDLLTLARADTAQLNLMKEQIDLGSEAGQIIRTLTPMAQAKSITLKTKILDGLMIYADRERIAQLLRILLDNAIKYTPDGGMVELSIQWKGDDLKELRIGVRDNGIGIAPGEQERIFERFYRIDKTRSREMGGSGLGLAIAKWITEIHGGSIKVISQPGAGSEFVVTLPL